MQWVVMSGGAVTGPHSTEDLAQACRERRMGPQAWIREEPGGTWQRADQGPFSALIRSGPSVNLGRILLGVVLFLILMGVWIR